MKMHNVFISYHHKNDQYYKNRLLELNDQYGLFIDCSVATNDIDDTLPPQKIREVIRDTKLRTSTVTILLCGLETQFRKHVDWELKSSMIDGPINKKSGILVVDLPETSSSTWYCAYPEEKQIIYPEYQGGWRSIETKADYQETFPEMPERVTDNLLNPDALISVIPWHKIEENPHYLSWLIEKTAAARSTNKYDLSLPMRMRDHNPLY